MALMRDGIGQIVGHGITPAKRTRRVKVSNWALTNNQTINLTLESKT